jgi:hypothetical protein
LRNKERKKIKGEWKVISKMCVKYVGCSEVKKCSSSSQTFYFVLHIKKKTLRYTIYGITLLIDWNVKKTHDRSGGQAFLIAHFPRQPRPLFQPLPELVPLFTQ